MLYFDAVEISKRFMEESEKAHNTKYTEVYFQCQFAYLIDDLARYDRELAQLYLDQLTKFTNELITTP
jgi:hypothetical protein